MREIATPLDINIDSTNVKALGIQWNPRTDSFSFRFNLKPDSTRLTKRLILSDIAKVFDPFGWLAPITIRAKMMMQKLWLTGLNWDETVTEDLNQDWKNYLESLQRVHSISVPRWIGFKNDVRVSELHGFCDASMKAYCASVYIRLVDTRDIICINLLISKTKVAPIKTVSLPRLELCAASLLAKLIAKVRDSLKMPINKVYTWTDSSIVLSWIKGHPSKWKTFVANRVSQIHEILGENHWNHVPSKENPADCGTRGLKPEELRDNTLWWTGPHWLKESSDTWPKGHYMEDTNLEVRKVTSFHVSIENEFELPTKYSTLNRLLRVTAYCQRFIRNCKRKEPKETCYLKSHEIEEALKFWIIYVQKRNFKEDILALKLRKPLPKSSRLLRLDPFLDKDGLIRVGGRLRYAELPYNEKFPFILPPREHLMELVIKKAHYATMHGGPQLTINFLQKNYWILSARNAVKSVIHKCITCFRQRLTTRTQLMGDLPSPRVNVSKPFSHTGIDYCGPFDIKNSRTRNSRTYKGYVAIFICLATKAIHIEIVSDLTADGFLAAFRRFVSRRGLCSDLYSDCGSNFIGANNIMTRQQKQMVEQLNNEIAEVIETEGVKWHLIPPASPHFGGLWEAGVKSTKYHMKRILGSSILTYEEFSTVLVQIEACLNSRPICPVSNDPADLTALTPGHFLVGRAILTPPEPAMLDLQINRLDRWQHIQRLYQSFWSRWNSEYLSRLQQRPKWNQREHNIKIGDLVIIKEERLPPSRWILGRIVSTHPGADNLVRVVTIKTKNTVIKRPITKICQLPIQDN